MQIERHRTAAATMGSALVGATLFVSLAAYHWPRPIIDWIRVIVSEPVDALPTEPVVTVFIVVTILLMILVLAARWVLQRLRIVSPTVGLAVLLILAFAISFAFEATSQVARAWGDLTASDAAGRIIENGELTAHGWSTIARRAVIATLYASVMALAFCVTRHALSKRLAFQGRSRPK